MGEEGHLVLPLPFRRARRTSPLARLAYLTFCPIVLAHRLIHCAQPPELFYAQALPLDFHRDRYVPGRLPFSLLHYSTFF